MIFLICNQLMRHPLTELFYLSNLLQMPNDHRMVDNELFSNFVPSIVACDGSIGALFLGSGTGYVGMSTLWKLIELYTYNMCTLLYVGPP